MTSLVNPRDLDRTLVVNVSKRYSQPDVVLPTFTQIHHVLTPKISKQRRESCLPDPSILHCSFLILGHLCGAGRPMESVS